MVSVKTEVHRSKEEEIKLGLANKNMLHREGRF